MGSTKNIFGDDPFKTEEFTEKFPDQESTPLIFMTTTSNIEGKSIAEYHGMVFGEAACGIGMVTAAYQQFEGFFGKRAGASERRMEQVRRQAMFNASEHAKSLGANAIVGARVDYEYSGAAVLVAVSGTAVTAEL